MPNAERTVATVGRRGAVPQFLVAMACALAGCGEGGLAPSRNAESQTNLLLISVDTLRADHLGIYGYGRDTSPNLDRFFATGNAFALASSTAPCTLPSIRQTLYGAFDVSTARPLAEVLREAGYATAAVVSQHQIHKDGVELYARGFASFDLQPPEQVDQHAMTSRKADEVSDRALAWLDAHAAEGKFFLWLHYFDPHDPYDPPAGFLSFVTGAASGAGGDVRSLRAAARRTARRGGEHRPFDAAQVKRFVDLYDGEIQFTDFQIGRVLEDLERRGLDARTLVVFTSDHGELLGEAGLFGHCKTLRQEVIRVPLLVRTPGGRLRDEARPALPASTLDVLPTALAELGIGEGGASRPGLDLRRAPEDRTLLAFWKQKSMIRQGPWKQVFARGVPEALYDLARDPGERTNLLESQPAVQERLSRSMAGASDVAARVERENEQVVELLQKIGYIE